MIEIDDELALAVLGIFAVIVIVGTILFVTKTLGIQTYSVLEVGTPCNKVYCDQRWPAQEIARDLATGEVYCQCENGQIKKASFYS